VSQNIRDLAVPNAARRRNAATDLGNFTSNTDQCRTAATAVPALIVALKDREASVREMAACALGNIHHDPATTVPALMIALGDTDADVRKRAAGALTMDANCKGYTAKDLGSLAPSAVSALVATLRNPNSDVREAAGRALVTYGSDAGTSLPALIELLNDGNARSWAARIIGAIGPDAQPAVAALTAMLQDNDIEAQLDAATALARIGGNLPQALPVAAHLLSHDDPDIRFQAAVVVGLFGAAAQPAIPRLVVAMDDNNAGVRRVAIASFRKIIAALVEARRTDAIKVLQAAATAVARSGDHAEMALGPEIDEAIASLEAMQAPRPR
jgi:HEAT repeat protein